MKKGFLAFAFAAFLLTSCADDQTTTTTTTDGDRQTNLSNNERDFIQETAHGNLMEVELGQHAQQAATNQRVRNFAQMMVTDHRSLNDELRSLAQQKNVEFPNQMEDSHRNDINDLREKQGADFDREYMDKMVSKHEDKISKFENHQNSEDPQLRNFVNQHLPKIREHRDSAQAIKDQLPNQGGLLRN